MIVDFHTHCWPDELAGRALEVLGECVPDVVPYYDGTERGLVGAMDTAGIDLSVVLPVATRPSQVATINRAAAHNHCDRIVPFGALHPLCEAPAAEVAYLADHGVRGIKLHPEYQDFYVDDPALDRLYGPLQEAGLVVVFHAGWDPGPFTRDHATPPALRRVHERYPALKMVAAHMGGLMMWDEVVMQLQGLPIWFDTSAATEELTPARFTAMVRAHGADRVLFATDGPWFDMEQSRVWVENAGLSDSEREQVMGGNAAQLLLL